MKSLPKSIPELAGAGNPTANAILAPDQSPLTRGALASLIDATVQKLRHLGIRPDHHIAMVHHDGAQMAALFLAVSSAAAAAPLNPAYKREEFDFYLEDLDAKALVIQADLDSPARDVARERGITIINVTPSGDGVAGKFNLEADQPVSSEPSAASADIEDRVALVLHTSGTTSRPKIVPLTHRNLVTSAGSIAATLSLSEQDRSLIIMPLFHIHGLVGALLSSLYAESSVYCPGSFNALKFFGWLADSHATWYSAVPTMHQAILARADRNKDIVSQQKLRFVRSSSASMPPALMQSIEAVYGCPVIEAYGMTEASHQMASNPLPPASRKPGSVGLAAGPEIAIMDLEGRLLPATREGEIVIRGGNVTKGYAKNPQANATAFTDGWFRTGDLGILDPEGYLTISGRLKEIINRGGEKIAPREVDDVLMEHPAVAQVVTFALPHDKLGETVAAAVVLREAVVASESDLRTFVSGRLAAFKVPHRIVFVAEIPKGPTGKMQRIGMAQRLGIVE